ncbi:hypothetical protein ASL83_003186 [Vibrio parahaemolyticus]|nr:hypothetical protein [Vibrio parahaemolyticus]
MNATPPFGTQIKHHGKNHIVQFSAVETKSGQPTLAIEMTTTQNAWGKKNTIKMHLVPETELLALCIFLHPKNRLNSKSEFKTTRAQNRPKVLTIKVNDSNASTYFVGLADNNDKLLYNRVLGTQQLLSFRLIAFSRLASLYGCNVTDVMNMLEHYLN